MFCIFYRHHIELNLSDTEQLRMQEDTADQSLMVRALLYAAMHSQSPHIPKRLRLAMVLKTSVGRCVLAWQEIGSASNPPPSEVPRCCALLRDFVHCRQCQ